MQNDEYLGQAHIDRYNEKKTVGLGRERYINKDLTSDILVHADATFKGGII